jgi:hypothetical protein
LKIPCFSGFLSDYDQAHRELMRTIVHQFFDCLETIEKVDGNNRVYLEFVKEIFYILLFLVQIIVESRRIRTAH